MLKSSKHLHEQVEKLITNMCFREIMTINT
jgi:hypothetical protein